MKIYELMILFTILTAGVMTAFTIQHESVHERIMTQHGCLTVSIDYNFITPSTTVCLERHTAYNDTIALQEYKLHSQNEIVAYNVQSVLLTMILCTFMLSAILVIRK